MFSPARAILMKEWSLTMRSRRSVVLFYSLLILASAVFYLYWIEEGSRLTLASRTEFARGIFYMSLLLQYFGLSIVSPAMAASIVSSERENRTLELLTTTGLPRFGILMAKFFATVAYQIVLVICLMPILILVFQLGGVGADEYIAGALIVLQAVLVYGMIGLAFSCRSRKTVTAMLGAFLMILGFAGLIPGVIAWLGYVIFDAEWYPGQGGGWLETMFGDVLWASSGPACLIAELNNLFRSGGGGASAILRSQTAMNHLLFQAMAFVLFGWWGWRGLVRRSSGAAATAEKPIDDKSVLDRRRKRFPYYLIDPLRRAQSIPDGSNPVTVKDMRLGTVGRLTRIVRISYIGMFISVWLSMLSLNSADFDNMVLINFIILSWLAFFVPVLAGSGLSREREEGTLDLLRVTLLTPRQIVYGKFASGARMILILWISMLILPLIITPVVAGVGAMGASVNAALGRGDISFTNILRALPFPLAYLSLYLAVSVFCSAVMKRSLTAILSTYALIGLLMAFPAITWVLAEIFDDPPLRFTFVSHLFEFLTKSLGPVLSPWFYYVGVNRSYRSDEHYFNHWMSSTQIIFHTVVLVGLALGVLELAARRVARKARD